MSSRGFENRAVVVTGGAAGIGLATARRFATEGARVAIWDVAAGAGSAAAEEISRGGADCVFSVVDVTDADSVVRLTSALTTPGTRSSAFSTRETHDAQVMPSMASVTLLSPTV